MSLFLAVSAVFPILIYMLAGALLNRARKISAGTLAEMNQIIFSYCFPFVMFNSIYRADLAKALDLRFLGVMLALVLAVIGLSLLILPRCFQRKPVLGSMIQGIIRGNAVLFALPVVSVISGEHQTGLVTLCIAIIVPIYNVLCVVILEVLQGGRLQMGRLAMNVVKNPLIMGALAGLAARIAGLQLPPFLQKVIADLAGLVTPVALVLLGAGLHFSDTVAYRRELMVVTVSKLLLVPLLYVTTVKALGFGPVAVTTAMAFSAVPTAVSSYVMAKEMKADHVLAGQIVAVNTTLSILTVFLWVLVLSSLGWIG